MIGAITGDIIGSVYEFTNLKPDFNFPLFVKDSEFTDDTVLTVALADSILNDFSYLDKLRLYNNQKVIIGSPKKIKPNRIIFDAQVIGVDDTYKVEYLFYRNDKNNQWYIYDVVLVGVSIIQTYRNQFAEFLKTKSVTELTQSL